MPKGSVAATLDAEPVTVKTFEFVVEAGFRLGMAIKRIPLSNYYYY
jgi:hypothetical protein